MSCCYEFLKTFSAFVFGIQLVFGVFRYIFQNLIGPYFLEPKNLHQYGKWALVTGATDGIGKEYAISLAKRGLNIILVSRTLSKLEDVAKEISKSFNVETQVIAVDFTSGPEIYDQINQQIVGKEIGILINNVGMFYPVPELFLNIPNRERFIQDTIKCNITTVPMMCSLILPQMVERKCGLIINISSVAAEYPSPSFVIYSASKAFVTKFSADLGSEYESKGIDVQVLVPGFVATNMNKMGGNAFINPTASQYVKSAIRYIGYARHTTGYLVHSLMVVGIQFMSFIAPSLTATLTKRKTLSFRDKLIKSGEYTSAR